MSSDEQILFLLLPAPDRKDRSPPAADSFLFSLADGKIFVVQAYRGVPDEKRLIEDARASFSAEFSPLAIVEGHGDAVDIYRPTVSGLGAQIFAKPDRPYGVNFGLVDGHFFTPDPHFDARMRGSGMPCPDDLGRVKLTSRILDIGDDRDLDLACQYGNEKGTRITVFATLTSEPLDRVFATEMAHYRDPKSESQSVDLPWVTASPERFARAAAWRNSNGQGYFRAHWAGMRGRYLIQVHAIWNPEDEMAVRVAAGILEGLTFEPTADAR